MEASYGVFAIAAHVSGAGQAVVASTLGPPQSLSVQAFTQLQTAETSLGEVRIWSGGVATFMPPPPPPTLR